MNCFRCGHELILESDAPAYEAYGTYSKNDTAVVSYYHCPHCGALHEVVDCHEEEQKNYKFYEDNTEHK